MKKLFIILSSAFLLGACDSGDITDKVYSDETATFSAQVKCQVRGLETWPQNYNVCLAAFNGESDYSLVQKQLVPSDGQQLLTNIPVTATEVGIYVTNNLRRRVLTLSSVTLDDTQTPSDTVLISLPEVANLTMFNAIQSAVFDNSSYNCSACHGSQNPRAGLSLVQGQSYASLVDVPSSRVSGAVRVVSGDAKNSVLYQALEEGNPTHLRYDHSNLTTTYVVQLIKDWINNGALE